MKSKSIDLGEIKTSKDFHKKLAAELNFPDFYGNNWDAFWDSITGLVELPSILKFLNCENIQQKLPEDWKIFVSIFSNLKTDYPDIKCDVFFIPDDGRKSIFEWIIELLNWIKIFISPLIIGAFIALIIWINWESMLGKVISVLVLILGLVLGIYFAEYTRRRQGTQEFMSGLYRSRDFDEQNKES